MTIKSIEQLLLQADTTIQDNVSGQITAADVRNLIKDFLDTIGPGYGVAKIASLAKAVTTAMSKITPFSTLDEQTAGYYNVSLANGTVSRLITTAGLVGATDFLVITGSVAGPNNGNITLEVYKNGAPTGIKQSVTCTGTSDKQGINLTGLSYTAGTDAEYDVRCLAAGASNYTFTDMQILAQSQAVRAF